MGKDHTLILGVSLVSGKRCKSTCYNAMSAASTCDCICDGKNHGIERVHDEPQQQRIIIERNELQFMAKDQFYKNEQRKLSREIDFGVWWRDGRNYPVYRVTWVEKTGEVYAIDQGEHSIEILGTITSEAEVERRLDGWATVCGLMNSLQWVRGQVV